MICLTFSNHRKSLFFSYFFISCRVHIEINKSSYELFQHQWNFLLFNHDLIWWFLLLQPQKPPHNWSPQACRLERQKNNESNRNLNEIVLPLLNSTWKLSVPECFWRKNLHGFFPFYPQFSSRWSKIKEAFILIELTSTVSLFKLNWKFRSIQKKREITSMFYGIINTLSDCCSSYIAVVKTLSDCVLSLLIFLLFCFIVLTLSKPFFFVFSRVSIKFLCYFPSLWL